MDSAPLHPSHGEWPGWSSSKESDEELLDNYRSYICTLEAESPRLHSQRPLKPRRAKIFSIERGFRCAMCNDQGRCWICSACEKTAICTSATGDSCTNEQQIQDLPEHELLCPLCLLRDRKPIPYTLNTTLNIRANITTCEQRMTLFTLSSGELQACHAASRLRVYVAQYLDNGRDGFSVASGALAIAPNIVQLNDLLQKEQASWVMMQRVPPHYVIFVDALCDQDTGKVRYGYTDEGRPVYGYAHEIFEHCFTDFNWSWVQRLNDWPCPDRLSGVIIFAVGAVSTPAALQSLISLVESRKFSFTLAFGRSRFSRSTLMAGVETWFNSMFLREPLSVGMAPGKLVECLAPGFIGATQVVLLTNTSGVVQAQTLVRSNPPAYPWGYEAVCTRCDQVLVCHGHGTPTQKAEHLKFKFQCRQCSVVEVVHRPAWLRETNAPFVFYHNFPRPADVISDHVTLRPWTAQH